MNTEQDASKPQSYNFRCDSSSDAQCLRQAAVLGHAKRTKYAEFCKLKMDKYIRDQECATNSLYASSM